jgi:hypothetical protein
MLPRVLPLLGFQGRGLEGHTGSYAPPTGGKAKSFPLITIQAHISPVIDDISTRAEFTVLP